MPQSWFVLVPPCVVIILATLTRRIQFSLFMGIITAALVVNNFVLFDSIKYVGQRLYQVVEVDKLTSFSSFLGCSNLFIVLFLILLGIIITMIRYSGAAHAYGNYVVKRIKTPQGVERASLLLSSFFFIDDYFSCLTVGSVMQPIADSLKVPRVKLALLVNAVAAPFAILFPLSSWIAELVAQFRNSGVCLGQHSKQLIIADPLGIYISAIPFMIYAITMIVAVWFIVLRRVSFGIFLRHEVIARKTGELFGGKMPLNRRLNDVSDDKKRSSSVIDFIVPLVSLFVFVIGLLLWFGESTLFGGENSLFLAIQSSNIFAAFFFGGLAAVVLTGVLYLVRKRIVFAELLPIVHEGFSLMSGSLVMLLFIWTFSRMLRADLQAGNYIAQLLLGRVDAPLLPLMFFGLTGFTAMMIGTAWGTIGIMLPLSLEMVPVFLGLTPPVALADIPMLSAVLGAVISGSIIGMHMSPIADVMVMTATSVGSYHLDLVRGQISVTLPVIVASALGYLSAGYVMLEYGSAAAAFAGISVAGFSIMAILTVLHIVQTYSSQRNR